MAVARSLLAATKVLSANRPDNSAIRRSAIDGAGLPDAGRGGYRAGLGAGPVNQHVDRQRRR